MEILFDHLIVAAEELAAGARWVEGRLGVAMGPGGKHALMGTHNRLLHLGPGRFLEVIAIDPAAPAPARPRWFELDTPAMRARLARGPALIHWAARTADIEATVAEMREPRPEILDLERGDFRWRIAVLPDGSLPPGEVPTILQWLTLHPSEVLPDAGCRLESLEGLVARIATPGGSVELRE